MKSKERSHSGKWPWITALAVCAISLIIGASFHGLRMHPENVANYQLGCTMGIVMASISGTALITFIILFVLYKKTNRSKGAKK